MQLGVCGSPALAPVLAGAGFDYLEVNVVRDLQPEAAGEAVAGTLTARRELSMPAPVANVFLPGSLKVTGPDVDPAAQEQYVRTAFRRAQGAGIELIVFGSGGARRIPAGFDRTRAWAQLVDFGRRIGPLAEERGVTIAVEPLNYAECNVLNTVAESAQYVRDVDHPGVRLLVDAFHWARNAEPVQSIIDAGPLLVHAHLATYANRLAPGEELCDFAPFLAALAQAGYRKRLSVEASWVVDLESARRVQRFLSQQMAR